jgi:hypothetical protein
MKKKKVLIISLIVLIVLGSYAAFTINKFNPENMDFEDMDIDDMEKMQAMMENMPDFMKDRMPDEAQQFMEGSMPEGMDMNEIDMQGMDMNEIMQMMKERMGGGERIDISQGAPKFATYDFIQLDRIEKISKIRSGYGHDYSRGTDETCRSMKHYYWAKGGDPSATHNPLWMTIKYFAPASGTIRDIHYSENEYGTEAQFTLHPTEQTSFRLKFYHVKLLDSISEGISVTAGQEIGTVGHEEAHGEIAVEVDTTEGMQLISFLEIVNDDVFAEYQARGIISADDVIIPRAVRDANPLECDYSTDAGYFVKRNDPTYQAWASGPENWVTLN